MLIILEGSDCSGKTQLAQHLQKMLGFEIVKFSQPKGDSYVEYMDFLLNRKKPAIVDRFHMGAMTYGPLKRGKVELNDWQFRNIELMLQMRNALTIYCRTSDKEIISKMKERGEEYLKPEEVNKLLWNYEDAIKNSRLEWIRYNYLEDGNYNRIDAIILEWYKNIIHNLSHIQSLIPLRTFGNYYASTLILGDISHIELEKPLYQPVNIGFANGPSAEILFRALEGNMHKVAISNVRKVHLNREIILKEELMLPNIKRIILLGNVAYENYIQFPCANNFHWLSVRKTYHPAFVSRGGIKEPNYKRILNDLIV